MRELELPHGYAPRGYQLKAWHALEHGAKRAVLVWHRRAGKDLMLLNRTICASQERTGVYWHVFPAAKQGRKIIWDGVTKDGRPFLDYWPKDLIAERNATEMRLKLTNGSVWQVVGSDNYNDALIGGNPVGLVMSEYALQNPSCWNYLRPMLAENEGWAAFAFTPRGKNHGYDLFQIAEKQDDWFCERLTAAQTNAISQAAIDKERADGMPTELIEQEFYCSFEAALVGAYYGKLMKEAQEAGRIGKVPWERDVQVHTIWDLGIGDPCAIWFVQQIGREIHLIDYIENAGEGLPWYAAELKKKPYVYGKHIVPHDAKARELGTGKTRVETLQALGLIVETLPQQRVEDGINAVRNIIPRCWFDAEKCKRGIEALKQYQQQWDDDKKTFLDKPLHDWSSHGADGFRYLAIGLPEVTATKPIKYDNRWIT